MSDLVPIPGKSEAVSLVPELLARLEDADASMPPQLVDDRTAAEREPKPDHPDKGKSCAGCGLCCKLFFLGFDPLDTEQCINMITKATSHESMRQSLQDWKFILRNFRKVAMGPKAWTCAAYDGVNGVCTAYDERPKLCRGFFCKASETGGKPGWEEPYDVKAADPSIEWSKLKVEWKPREANTARQNGYTFDKSESNEHDCGVRAAESPDAVQAGVHDLLTGERRVRDNRVETQGRNEGPAATVHSEEEKVEIDLQSHECADVLTEKA